MFHRDLFLHSLELKMGIKLKKAPMGAVLANKNGVRPREALIFSLRDRYELENVCRYASCHLKHTRCFSNAT